MPVPAFRPGEDYLLRQEADAELQRDERTVISVRATNRGGER
jgi:hypothetical protein